MILKNWLANFPKVNRINRFSNFYLNFLNNQSKNWNFTKLTFCTGVSQNLKDTASDSADYYREYMLNNADKFSAFRYVELIKEKPIINSESVITDLLSNINENVNSDEEYKLVASVLSNWDVDKMCEGILLIRAEYFKDPNNPNIEKLIEYFNKELCCRKLSDDENLKILQLFRSVHFGKNFYSLKGVLRLLKKMKNLTPEEMVQFFFSIPKYNFSKVAYKYSALIQLNDKISHFSADEMGIITRGLVRANLTFNYRPIIGTIFDKMIENLENIHSIPLHNMTYALFKLDNSLCPERILDFQEKCIPYVSNFNTTCLLSISGLGLGTSIVNYSFWKAIVKKFREEICNLTPLNLKSIVQQAVVYETEDEELLLLAAQEFEKFEIIPEHIDELVFLLYYLSHKRIYPKNLLDIALSENVFSNIIYGSKKTNLKFHWWALYCNVEIEKPEYITSKLSIKNRLGIFKLCKALFDQQIKCYENSNYYNTLTSIKYNAIKLYGAEAVMKTYCLPHFECGLVLRFNKNLEPEPIPQDFYFSENSLVKKPTDNDHYWIFLCVLSGNQYVKVTRTLSVHRQTQCRQLEALGYIPIMVPKMLYKGQSDQVQNTLFSNLIKEALEKKKQTVN